MERPTTALLRDVRAQVGIGTMIVFIATVLVAAMAAAMLLDTIGKLQERSSTTGNEATQQVSANLLVKGMYGTRPDTTSDIEDLNISLSLAPGSQLVDLSETVVMLTDGTAFHQLTYAQAHANDKFTAVEVRDPANRFTVANPTLGPGTLIDLQINLNNVNAGGGMTLGTREDFTLYIIPEVGHQVTLAVEAPSSFGQDLVIGLR